MTHTEASWQCLECLGREDICEIIVRVTAGEDTVIRAPHACPYGFSGCVWRRVQ